MPGFFVRIRPERIPETIELLHTAWDELSTGTPLPYRFLDDELRARYRSDQRWSRIVTSASILAILVACLGLFGLIALSVATRRKEIGIRKVLGASIFGIILMLTKEFTKWVFLACVIALPLAYYAMNQWLENFAYRTSISLGIFVVSALMAALISVFTISYQSIKAALSNPIDSLRYE